MERHSHPAASHSYLTDGALAKLALGGAMAGGAVMLAPHVLPALGIGHAALAEESLWVLHTSAEAGGSGLAGAISSLLSAIPVIGERLASGGLFNAAAAGVIGIGGVLLGNYLEKHEDGDKRFKWGKALKYAAMATSALIALPTVLTAIGSGLIYLSTLTGDAAFASNVVGFIGRTLGTMGRESHALMGFSGIAAVIPHLLTCGVSVLPAALAYTLPSDGEPSTSRYSDSSIRVALESAAPITAGQPYTGRLHLTHADSGQPVTPEELAITHTEKMHLFIVDASLKDYHHIHPRPTHEPGVFAFTFTPSLSHAYSAWADFAVLKDGRNHRVKTTLPASVSRNIIPRINLRRHADCNGLHVEWRGESLRPGTDNVIELRVTDAQGNLVTNLEPTMGAYAHLVGFSADGDTLIHTHPLGAAPLTPEDRGPGLLRFHIAPDFTGDAQFYLQIRCGGQDQYVSFGQHIAPEHTMPRSLPQIAAGRTY